jgi:Holliday junction resolvase RusA-like endonuclease
MKSIEIFLDIPPQPKERARVTFQNGKAHSYTPKKTEDTENYIRAAVMQYYDYYPRETPVYMEVTFYMPEPKRSKYDWPITRPDIDNYAKLLIDSITEKRDGTMGILKDDAQITTLLIKKRYSDTVGISLKLKVDRIGG